ncbi:OmpA family protein [Kushneria phosphatilytica]|uniref:OmpA family protein n=1 Tax=Kushneria phosphatilytica TaxID=657387 RepID=A0A1S1NVK2_9GAMM|nr:OmpA family protein [Kushneria phosphatilytica]OHV11991.1 flagellar motor protein MotB [Kushneria phosphatilytica]QEL11176.1 OmpA family protein [Kushneria phosphatilytica]
MNKSATGLLLGSALVLGLSGCASSGSQSSMSSSSNNDAWYSSPFVCGLAGGLIGGGIGYGVSGHDDEETGSAVGGVAGATAGALLCSNNEPEVLDSDNDGVPDDRDQCPGTPAGVAVDAQGCPLDSDGDGVPDYQDQCPGTPAGVEVNAQGCPLDSDGDGVPDYQDQCPNTPAGAKVNALGCVANLVLKNVNFKFDSAELTSNAQQILDGVAQKLNANESVRVKLKGYTDSIGTEAYNKDLSQRRADSVKQYLVSQGVSTDRIETQGYGESNPVATNSTAEGRAQNRRTEVEPLGDAGQTMDRTQNNSSM